jgi:hypothetical protein
MTRISRGAKAMRAVAAFIAISVIAGFITGCSSSEEQARQAAMAAQQAESKAEQAEAAAVRARQAAEQAQIAADQAQKAVEDATRETNRVADHLDRINRENDE